MISRPPTELRFAHSPAQAPAAENVSTAAPYKTDRENKQADRAIATLIACQLVFWTIVPLYLTHSMPLDVVSDMLPWGHEWQLGYYKHPPLPAWLAEFAFDRLSDTGVYLLSQTAIVVTYLFVYLLGAEMMPRRIAAAGTVLLVGVFYFSVPTPEFNNNVAQMPIWAAAAYFLYKGLHSERWQDWFWLGVAAGLGMLAKYSTATLLTAMVIYTAVHPDHRKIWRGPRPYLAIIVAFAIFAPHLGWLIDNHFATLTYAGTRAGVSSGFGTRLVAPVKFLLSQAADHLPLIPIAIAGGLMSWEFGRGLAQTQKHNFQFLLAIGLGPAAITAILSVLAGLGLRDMWGTPMWNLSGLATVLGAASYWQKISLRNLYAGAVVIFCLSLLGYAFAVKIIPDMKGGPSRLSWPDKAMAQQFSREFQRVTGKPLRIVGGDDWLAGMIAMRSPQRPSVISGGEFSTAPWITPARLEDQGALIVWRHGAGKHFPATLLQIRGSRLMGTANFLWPAGLKGSPLMVDWGVIVPQTAQNTSPPSVGATP